MSTLWTDGRILTRVGIIEMLAVQLYNQNEWKIHWQELDASDRVRWRKMATKMYDEALVNYTS